MYTDIDIFKEDINTFLWNDKEGNKENRTLGNLRDVIEMSEKAEKTGHGSQSRGRRAPISSHYLTNTICRREWTLQPVDICDTERNLSPFSLSGSASTWTFSALLNGMDSNTRIRCLPVHGFATCFISSCPFQRLTRGSTLAWSRPVPSNHKEWLYCSRGGDFPGCYS